MSNFQKDLIMNNITWTNNFQDLKNCDIFIEAVSEELETKKKILSQFENISSKNAIFATNTSALQLSEVHYLF